MNDEIAQRLQHSAHPLPHPELDALQASMSRRKSDLAAMAQRREDEIAEHFFVPKRPIPGVLYEEDRHPPQVGIWHVSLRGVLFGISALLVISGAVGLIRGCTA